MNKIVVAGVLATMVTAAPAFAQAPAPQPGPAQSSPGPQGSAPERGRWAQMSPDDRAAFLDARIASLKALLRLNAEQERLWPPVEAALREAGTLRAQRMQQWREMRSNPNAAQLDPIQRLRAGAERMAESAASMKKLADAAQPLYASLDANQKRRADAILSRGRGMMGGGMDHGPRRWQRGENRQ
ncbi:Spy/CpxP family protein refolding chaperone [Phreatobacter stygius]|nr:Spy/CpxP family protein refolding chaperone [Phreatobacter stygius]